MVSEAASYPRSHAQLCSHPYSKNHRSPLRPDHVASEGSLALEWQWAGQDSDCFYCKLLIPNVRGTSCPHHTVLSCGQTHLLLPLCPNIGNQANPGQTMGKRNTSMNNSWFPASWIPRRNQEMSHQESHFRKDAP